MTPTKLSQRRIDGVINSGSDSPHDTLPINAEIHDSSDEGPVELRSSSRMDISGCHSGDKKNGSAREALAASRQICKEEVPSCHQCIKEIVATSKVPNGSALYNFVLTFLVNRKNEKGFADAKEPKDKLGCIQYNFKQSHR
ncbi:uncharacterized protein Fot_44732 [Forsythia ovata]|uniref:Uncharacterized protein n=1 Tax=Forsythia ovata TaxID=205694 RepID=A0ABD1R4B8_9LAMI